MTYNPDSINLFNVEFNDEECIICKEQLNSEETYTLPECCHVYHTNCIVTWFRNGNSNCPHCGNKGINNYECQKSYYRRRSKSNPKYNDLKKYAYSKNKLKECEEKTREKLKKYFEKIKLMEDNVKKIKEELKEFKKSLKEKEVNYNECKKTLNNYRNRIWNTEINLNKAIRKLLDKNYIVPIIIPTKIMIN